MAYADELAKDALAIRFALRISGIDRVWATFPLPSAWGSSDTITISSENYTWDRRFIVDERMSAISSNAEPKRGIGTSGSQTFHFQLTGTQRGADPTTDAWLDLVAAAVVDRTDIDKTTLREDLLPDVTAQMEVIDSTPFSGSGDTVHIGTEAIVYATTATSPDHELETLTRGRFGSLAQTHYASFSGLLDVGAGAYVSTIPLAWRGRTVTLYVIPGTEDDARFFTPSASTLVHADNGTYTWLLQDMAYDEGTLQLAVDCVGIETLLQRPVMQNQPKARLGIVANQVECAATIIIDDASNHMTWQFIEDTSSAQPRAGRVRHVHIQTDAASPPSEITDGLYTSNTIARYMAQTLKNETTFDWSVTIRWARLFGEDQDDADSPLQKVIEFYVDDTAFQDYSLTIPISDAHSVWRELGFTESASVAPTVIAGNKTKWVLVADKRAPVFRCVTSPLINRRLYYHNQGGDPFKPSPGWIDDSGASINGFVRVNGEILEYDTDTSTTREGFGTFNYLDVVGRAKFGSNPCELYIESQDDPQEVKWLDIEQGMAFPNTSWLDAFQYTCMGGSGVAGHNDATYDKGWQGGGAFIDSNFFDTAGISAVDAFRRPVRDVAFFQGDSIAEAFENEARLDQLMVVIQGGKITITESRPPVNGETADHTIDSSVTYPDSGVEIDISHAKVINRIKWKGVYDHGEQKFRQPNGLSLHVNSIQTWGETDPLPVEVKSISDSETVSSKIADMASEVFARYAEPYAIITFDTGHKKSWAWEVGDTAQLTIPQVPKLTSAGRGLTNVLCRIYRKEDNLFGRPVDAVRSTVTVIPQNMNGAIWAPAAYVASGETSPDGGFTWTTTNNKYSVSGDAIDLSYFAATYVCRVFNTGDESGAVTRTIDSISTADVTFTVAVALTPPFIIEFTGYAAAVAAQLNYLYMSDGDGKLDGASTDVAYRFV
jgi:hypothetical protein